MALSATALSYRATSSHLETLRKLPSTTGSANPVNSGSKEDALALSRLAQTVRPSARRKDAMDSPTEDWRPAQMTPTPRSETLPRNFSYRYYESQRPRTPEPAGSNDAPAYPPEPPQLPKLRIKRRRPAVNSLEMQMHSEAAPVPTIELSESQQNSEPANLNITEHTNGYLAPAPSTFPGRSITPPTTPLGRISNIFPNTPASTNDWSQHNRLKSGNSIVRPSSTWSEMSDSSSSSRSSAGASYSESCTSPETEADPFQFHESPSKEPSLASPLQMHSRRSSEPKVSTPKLKWTPELDKHLWDTYLTYLADPTVTPFKMLPGTAPPLGVCYRVARKAKATWKGPRYSLDTIMEDGQIARVVSNPPPRIRREASAPLIPKKEADSPETIVPTEMIRSHSSAEMSPKIFVKWPRSASSTRRRLRELCKRKPTLPPHYQRLMQNRSPSPFESSSSQPKSRTSQLSSPPSRPDADSSFATRDMNLSLATSISSTMQPDGPLTQITSEVQTPRQQNIDSAFDPPSARFSAHQKSQSLQLGLGLGSSRRNEEFRRLASPFQEGTIRAQAGSSSTIRNEDVHMDDTRPKLQSPLEIHAPRPLSGSMKRRAQYQLGEEMFSDDADTRRNFLEGMFRDNAGGKRRVRSRGFSMGAVSHGPPTRPLAEIFIPPPPSSEQESPHVTQQEQPQIPRITATAAPQEGPSMSTNDLARRLGSPFAPTANNSGFSNTFPRSLFPQGLDTIANLEQQHQDPFAPSGPR